jgi:hypothetical protein
LPFLIIITDQPSIHLINHPFAIVDKIVAKQIIADQSHKGLSVRPITMKHIDGQIMVADRNLAKPN